MRRTSWYSPDNRATLPSLTPEPCADCGACPPTPGCGTADGCAVGYGCEPTCRTCDRPRDVCDGTCDPDARCPCCGEPIPAHRGRIWHCDDCGAEWSDDDGGEPRNTTETDHD